MIGWSGRMAAEYQVSGSYGRGEALPHHRHLVAPILALLPGGQGQRAMDVGCGNGFISSQIASRGYRVTGIDFDAQAIDIAKKAYPAIEFVRHEAEDRFPDFARDLDLVTAFEVIEHLYSPQKFLRRVFETLKPGGHVILSTPYHGYWKNLATSILGRWDHVFTVDWEAGHIKFFSDRTMEAMLRQVGFTDVVFRNAGRVPYLWKTLLVRARRP